MTASSPSDSPPTGESTDPVRDRARALYGTVPNFMEEMHRYTSMPGAVYLAADEALTGGVLRIHEQQIVLIELARYHDCAYDAVIHARIGLDAGLRPAEIDALLAGRPPENSRHAALVTATRTSCEERGWLGEETQTKLREQGVGLGELYEIFGLIGMKTFTAFTHHVSEIPVDDALQSLASRMESLPEKPDEIDRKRLFVG